MSRRARVQRFGHVTYVGAASSYQDPALSRYQALFTDVDLVTPTGKFPHMSSADPRYSLTMLAGIPPVEILAFDHRGEHNQPIRLLPTKETAQRQIAILSSSFTPQFIEAFAELFDVRGDGILLTTPDGPWKVSFDLDERAPAFDEQFDGTTGPVSIAIYCRGISGLEDGIGDTQDAFGGVVGTSHGTYRFLMIRVMGVWVECLERLAVSHD